MAYTSGDTIEATHYNSFRNSINGVWGSGSGNSGYGQTTVIPAVAAAATVTATQWSTLLARLSSAASHQGTTITALTAPTAGTTISAYTALQTNVNSVVTNRLNHAALGSTLSSTIQGTETWYTQSTHTCTFGFAGGNQARYFFNAGGELRLSFARSGGTANDKNAEWTDLCTKAGTIAISSTDVEKIGGSGTHTIQADKGYYNLTTTDQEIFRQYADTSPYTTNYISVLAKVSSAHADGLGNNGNQLIVTVIYRDDASDDGSATLDRVDGTLTTTYSHVQPSTTHISSTWGTPSRSATNAQS